jgi:GT2 family glycosyltransferase
MITDQACAGNQMRGPKIFALTTVFNRIESTRVALLGLEDTLNKLSLEHEIIVVDDKSTDGTSEMLRKEFPTVRAIETTGDYFWARGMGYGFSEIEYEIREADFLIAFNDDSIFYTEPLFDELERYFQKIDQKSVFVGCFEDEDGNLSYGGRVRESRLHPLKFKLQAREEMGSSCETMNFNFVVIPASHLKVLGFLDKNFSHKYADFEIGLRFSRSGVEIITSSNVIGFANRNSYPKFENFYAHWQYLLGIKDQPVRERLYYYRHYGGVLWPLWFLSPYLKSPFRFFWRRFTQ